MDGIQEFVNKLVQSPYSPPLHQQATGWLSKLEAIPTSLDLFPYMYNLAMFLLQHETNMQAKIDLAYRMMSWLPDDFPPEHLHDLEYNLGVFYGHLHRYAPAMYHFRRALAIAPTPAQRAVTLAQIGYIYTSGPLKDTAKARRFLAAAQELDPNNFDVCNKLVLLHVSDKQPKTALSYALIAVELMKKQYAPRLPAGRIPSGVYLNTASCLHELGRLDECLEMLQHAVGADRNLLAYQQLLFVKRQQIARYENIRRESEGVVEHLGHPLVMRYTPLAPCSPSATTQPLRIALLSADFVNHPVGDFAKTILAQVAQDPRVAIYAYYAKEAPLPTDFPGVTWRTLPPTMPAEEVVNMIKRDGIDILLDLSGHTTGNRLDVLALKAAPVQASYLGYAATTGMANVDFYLAEGLCCGPRTQEQFVEKVVCLGSCYVPRVTLPLATRPSRANITFGSFCRLNKITPPVLQAWARILREVPAARLVLKAYEFGTEGLDREFLQRFPEDVRVRITALRATATHGQHVEMYNLIDIALDTWPYSNTTSTCESLYMGVPMITLRDEEAWTYCQNMGSSILMYSGLGAFVARSEEQYVRLAARLARGELPLPPREEVRRKFLEGPMCDQKAYTEQFIQTMREISARSQ